MKLLLLQEEPQEVGEDVLGINMRYFISLGHMCSTTFIFTFLFLLFAVLLLPTQVYIIYIYRAVSVCVCVQCLSVSVCAELSCVGSLLCVVLRRCALCSAPLCPYYYLLLR